MNKKPILSFMEKQPGDVMRTCADISLARSRLGYQPKVSLTDGLLIQMNDLHALYRRDGQHVSYPSL
ncbi:hypothetical protein [Brevibacillus daliensis]|uniref:hypothetical protein n=1 Tax=Brevibacillus daliensis TaxID=2892995 RepID=UPI001E2B7242|nr:hypothetical protein [Brevibacillus daliensis]